ncbi:MAG: glycosyltransferase family 25 protein [Rhodobacteraceae bacterium]|nr:glycosyltransferase family 25 protein [Paracoccaceae bacterium]
MPGDVRRAPNVAQLLRDLPRPEVIAAVDGAAAMAAGTIPTAPGNLWRPEYPFRMGAGEIGCFLSHRACWQRIVDDNLDWALIAEDDMQVREPLWSDAMSLIETHMRPDRVIRLPAKPRERATRVVARAGAVKLVVPRRIGLQTVCQIVGREAALRLLAASTRLDRPVDSFMQMHWATGQPVWTVLPCPVAEATAALGGSTIQRRPAGSRIIREIARARYRGAVALRPQRPRDL